MSGPEYWKFCTRLLDDNNGPFSKTSSDYSTCWQTWNGANIDKNANPNSGTFYNNGKPSGDKLDDGARYDWCKANGYVDTAGKITGFDAQFTPGTCKWEWGNKKAHEHDERKNKKRCNNQEKCNFGIGTATKDADSNGIYSERYSNFFTKPDANKWYYDIDNEQGITNHFTKDTKWGVGGKGDDSKYCSKQRKKKM